ncbi:MAG: dienelactone hydrolase family protein [Chloroflexi bacterium]|nr:dienelactone hydrolase family protein [Chloroflexota bacterium]
MAESVVSLHARYLCEGKPVDGYLSHPVARGPWPAVVILHEWWGLDEHFRQLSQRLAREGFVALVPALYGNKLTSDWNEAALLKTSLDVGRAVRETIDAVPYLRSLPFCSGEMGVTGFCMGGGLALFAACQSPEFKAGVIYYPSMFPEPQEMANVAGPLQFHIGTEDFWTSRGEIERMTRVLEEHHKPHEVYWYEGATHAFMNDVMRPDVYHREAAETSFARTVEFFHAHLTKQPSGKRGSR